MNPKIKKLLYKLYLSIQGLTILIGSGFLIFQLIATPHDIYISDQGEKCVSNIIGPNAQEFMNWYKSNWHTYNKYGEYYWSYALERAYSKPAEIYSFEEEIKKKCSSFVRTYVSEDKYSTPPKTELNIWLNNYFEGSLPAKLTERLYYIGLTIGITLGFLGFFYGLMKWLSWLVNE